MEAPLQAATELSEAKRALLARRLKGLSLKKEANAPVQPRPANARVRISIDQYRLWLHHSMHPGVPVYNEPVSIFHDGPLDRAMLARSLELYANRHEAWRTGFVAEGEDVLQQIVPSVSVPVKLYDLSGFNDEKREAEDARLARENALQPFDLTRPPLLRAVLTRMSPTEDRLHLAIHHIVFDGTAIRDSFLPEIAAIYKALAAGEEPALAPSQLQYPDFSLWREEQLNSTSMERSRIFWKNQLQGEQTVLRLPADRPRPAVISQRGAMHRFALSPALTNALRETSQQQGATLYLTLLAALQVLLFRYSGQQDVIVGTGANGRRLPELQGVMGYMLDTFPVRVKANAEKPFTKFLN
ncbi:MAG: condensation domain-containing protein [Bryocella sp.]